MKAPVEVCPNWGFSFLVFNLERAVKICLSIHCFLCFATCCYFLVISRFLDQFCPVFTAIIFNAVNGFYDVTAWRCVFCQ
jgi:hypothetical protein